MPLPRFLLPDQHILTINAARQRATCASCAYIATMSLARSGTAAIDSHNCANNAYDSGDFAHW